MKKSRIARPIAAVESPTVRSLPLVELLVDTKAELFELMVRSGLRVLDVMLEEDRAALCGPRYAHLSERTASRAGTVPSEVVLGGRKVAVQRPRVRAEGREVPLPTFQALAQADPLNRRVVDQMLVGGRDAPVCAESRAAAGRGGEPRYEQEQRQPTVRGQNDGAAAGVASRAARRPRPRGAPPGRRPHRRTLPHRRPRDRGGRPETRPGPVGRGYRERDRVSELARQSPEPRAADGPQPPRDSRRRAGPPQSHAGSLRGGRAPSTVPGPQAAQHPGPPPGAPTPLGAGDRATRLSRDRREDSDL